MKTSKNPAKDLCYGDLDGAVVVVVVVRAVVNGSLDLTARAIVQQAFLFDLAKFNAAKKFTVQQQMNRARGALVIRRSKGTEHRDYVVTRVRIYRFLKRC